MPETVDQFLQPDGPIARRLPRFEPRPQQVEMARRIERVMAERGRLLVEAGTGVGKSFAYLLPAIRRAVDHGERVVVVTHTISLQEQLIDKDVPLLQAALPDEFTAVLVKGRGNYVSLRRLKLASERQNSLFPDAETLDELHRLEDWAYETDDGSLASLPQMPRADVWDRVQSDADNCMGRRCPTYRKCFFQTARRRMERANLLICNHALFFSDLSLRRAGHGFLPKYDHVILDEAHNVEDVACEHFGLSLSQGRLYHLLNLLYSQRVSRGQAKLRGFLTSLRLDSEAIDHAIHAVLRAREAGDAFFDGVAGLVRSGDSVRLRRPGAIDNHLTAAMEELTIRLRRLQLLASEDEHDGQDAFELNSYAERAGSIGREAAALVEQQMVDAVYWAESTRKATLRGTQQRVTLACSPIDVSALLNESLFSQNISVILTSATLTTGPDDFTHVRQRLGCDDAETLHLGSPFDYASQVRFIVDMTLVDPGAPDYVELLVPAVLKHVDATDGGAFVLFTSFSMLNAAAERLRVHPDMQARPLLVHGQDGPRGLLLKRFREDDRSVLLGTASFWQGVDVQGQGLRNVIITRLPFDVPDRPLIEARHEHIRSRGGNPFMDDSVPRAIIRFKQGFGRLIRSSEDHGRIVVLDRRILTKPYGRDFLAALPAGVVVERSY